MDQIDDRNLLKGDHGIRESKSSDLAGAGDDDSTQGLPSHQELVKKVNQLEQVMDYLAEGSLLCDADTSIPGPSDPPPP